MVLRWSTFKIISSDPDLHPRWLPWADIVLTYIVKPYGIWIVKFRCIRHADILERAYLCQVSDTGSPEPLVYFTSSVGSMDQIIILVIWNTKSFKPCLLLWLNLSNKWEPSWSWSYGSWIYNYLWNRCSGEVYSIQHYVIVFVSDLRQVGGFLWILQFPAPIKLTTKIFGKI
jgi:hypothetical protein